MGGEVGMGLGMVVILMMMVVGNGIVSAYFPISAFPKLAVNVEMGGDELK